MKDLDEYTLSELCTEVASRIARIDSGRCEYCGQVPEKPACRFPERHFAGRDDLLNEHIRSLEVKTGKEYNGAPEEELL